MNRRRLFLSTLGSALAVLIAICAPARAKEWREVRIASEGARPPWNFLDANGELAGFEIDLGQELCQRAKVTCVFVAQDWDGLVPNLVEGRYDAIMAAMEITDARLQTMDFSKPYARMPNAFVVSRQGELRDPAPAGMKGQSIGVEADGPHQAFLENVYPDSTVRAYASLEEGILDLAEGRVDSVFGDKDAVMDFMTNRREAKCCRVLDDVKRDPAFFGEGIGIGLRQSDQDLKELFNKALDEVLVDGAFERIRTKYFGFEIR